MCIPPTHQFLLFFFSFFSNRFSFNDLVGSFLLSFLASLSLPMISGFYELKDYEIFTPQNYE